MSFLKNILPYAIFAVALVLCQSNFASSLTCVSCSSITNATNEKCDNSEVNTKVTNSTCTADKTCGSYTYKVSDTVSTFRDCDVDCDKLKKSIDYNSTWSCTTCKDTDLCNKKSISGAPSTFGISLVPLIFTGILALNCY